MAGSVLPPSMSDHGQGPGDREARWRRAARLEGLTVWKMAKEKSTKKGFREYAHWMTSWREGGKVRNVHLWSCEKLSREDALQKDRKMKSEALGIRAFMQLCDIY